MTTYNTTKWLVSTIATISLSTPLIYAWSGLIASPNDTLDASKWNDLVNVAQTAYNWGNHGTVGYLTGETDPTVKSFAKATLPNCAADQVLKGDGSSLSCVTDSTTADNLGNHTATQNIKLSGYYLSND